MLLLISSLQRQACICHRQRLAASPPGCHSLPLARLRLRLAYPLHGGRQTRAESALCIISVIRHCFVCSAVVTYCLSLAQVGKRTRRFYMHYQRNSILFCLFDCGFVSPTPCTRRAFTHRTFCIIRLIQLYFNFIRLRRYRRIILPYII